jgi:hypothetical protein
MAPIDNSYELLQNAPVDTKQASKGWIRNEGQYKQIYAVWMPTPSAEDATLQ